MGLWVGEGVSGTIFGKPIEAVRSRFETGNRLSGDAMGLFKTRVICVGGKESFIYTRFLRRYPVASEQSVHVCVL
jgi:hypothetical protein